MVVLALVNLGVSGAIIYGLGTWFIDDSQRNDLVWGLLANIAQSVIQTIYLMASKNIFIAEAKAYANAMPQTSAAEIQSRTSAISAASQLEAAGVWPVIVFGMINVGLAYYFYSEAKEYDTLLDKFAEEKAEDGVTPKYPELQPKGGKDDDYKNADDKK